MIQVTYPAAGVPSLMTNDSSRVHHLDKIIENRPTLGGVDPKPSTSYRTARSARDGKDSLFLLQDVSMTQTSHPMVIGWAAAFDQWYDSATQQTTVRLFQDTLRLLFDDHAVSEQIGLGPAGVVVVDTDGLIEQVDTLKSAYDGASTPAVLAVNVSSGAPGCGLPRSFRTAA